MAIIKLFNGASLRLPGAYSSLKVSQPGGLPFVETGIVGIIGEATKGAPGATSGIVEYDSSTLRNLIDYFESGPICDAAKALVNASNDPRIANGAQRILVYKTNQATQATYSLATGWGTLTSQNYGVKENLISSSMTEDTHQVFTLVFGADWSGTPGANMTFRVNGGAVTTVTAASCTSAANTVTQLNTQFNTALGTSGKVYASAAGNRITLDLMASGTGAPRSGMGISLEFIAAAGWTSIGVTSGQQGVAIVAGSGVTGLTATNPTRSITVSRQTDAISETTAASTGEVGGNVYLNIGCIAATSATLTITSTTLSTSVVGAGASNLSITLNDYKTLNDLATYIGAQTGYTCSVPSGVNGGLPPSILDRVSSAGICNSTASIAPGQVKADAYEVNNWFTLNSQLVTSSRTSFLGLPDTYTTAFLSGGTLGSSTTSNFNDGFTAFEGVRANIIIPLVSQDAADDIVEDALITSSSSTYDVESIHTAAREHCKKMSNTQNRSERNCYVGYRGTFAQVKAQAKALNNESTSLVFQDVQVLDSTGNLTWKQPHILACLVAGLQAGSDPGTPATHKFISANSLRHKKKQGATPASTETFDSSQIGMKNQAIDAGLTIIEAPPNGGIRVVLHNTTYQNDANFVFNRVHVLDVSNFMVYDLRNSLEAIFVGEKAKTGTAESIRNLVIDKFRSYLDNDFLAASPDTNAPLGFKNLVVQVVGNTATIDATIYPVQGIEFILNRITLANLQQSA